MIDFQNVTKSFGSQDVLCDVSFRVSPGERVGLTGPNGAGKSTIFQLLTGELEPDSGRISIPNDNRIGYLRQQLAEQNTTSSLIVYTENAVGELNQLESEIFEIEDFLASLGKAEDKGDALHRLGELQTRYEQLGGYEIRTRAKSALTGLGFDQDDFSRPFSSFSGGWKMRAELARVLTAEPEILLLDEPTNYLDVEAVEWLRGYLRNFKGILLLISHDRYLLNTLSGVTLEVAGGGIERYAGNYDYYVKARRERHDQAVAAKKNQDRKREQIERFVERFRSQASKASQVQSRLKMLEKMGNIRIPGEVRGLDKIKMPRPSRTGREVVRLQKAGVSYNDRDWVFKNTDFILERGVKAAIVGFNGMGKTTLLRALAGVLPLKEGSRELGANVVPGYQAQDFTEVLDPAQTVFQSARKNASEANDSMTRSLLGGFGFSGESVGKKTEVLSGGEKVRLALACLLLRNPNFLLLDEPTTHLDIPARQALETALVEYGGTLCFVSHDIEFIRNVADTVYRIDHNGVEKYFGGYDYYRGKLAEAQDELAFSSGVSVAAHDSGDDRGTDAKEKRRRRAAFRKKQRHLEKPLREKARSAEIEVENLHQERNELLETLKCEVKPDEIAGVNRRLREIQDEIKKATLAWEEAELALENVVK